MSVSSLREIPENCVYRQGGFNCLIKYLHRKLLTTNFSLMILKVLKKHRCIYWICSELTDIDGKACNNIPEAVNKLALSASLDHSCETG
jgi:hypothetical protein